MGRAKVRTKPRVAFHIGGVPVTFEGPTHFEDPPQAETPPPPKQDEYTIHPVALKFPQLPPEEFAALKESIRTLGQFEPIIIDDSGAVLDSRHRYLACRELGIAPRIVKFVEVQGSTKTTLTAEEFIFDSNMKRRHLTESQRAAVAAEFANMRQGERTDLEPCNNCDKVSQEKAGELLKVSRGSVSRAKKVKAKDPEAFAKVKVGDMSLNAAVKAVEARDKVSSGSATDLQEGSAPAPTPIPQSQKEEEDGEPRVRTDRRSRSKRWNDACATAREAIDELISLQSEYQDWLNNLPANQGTSATAEKLDEIVDLYLEDALSTIEAAEGADLPKGFGRD